MTNDDYYVSKVFMSDSSLVINSIKTQVLNGFKQKIIDLELATEDDVILDALASHLLVLEDAYNISMYKFQFKIFTGIVNRELAAIREMVEYEETV